MSQVETEVGALDVRTGQQEKDGDVRHLPPLRDSCVRSAGCRRIVRCSIARQRARRRRSAAKSAGLTAGFIAQTDLIAMLLDDLENILRSQAILAFSRAQSDDSILDLLRREDVLVDFGMRVDGVLEASC